MLESLECMLVAQIRLSGFLLCQCALIIYIAFIRRLYAEAPILVSVQDYNDKGMECKRTKNNNKQTWRCLYLQHMVISHMVLRSINTPKLLIWTSWFTIPPFSTSNEHHVWFSRSSSWHKPGARMMRYCKLQDRILTDIFVEMTDTCTIVTFICIFTVRKVRNPWIFMKPYILQSLIRARRTAIL